MANRETPLWRRVLPWAVSAAALAYVFGWATDWRGMVEATRNANLPLFAFYVTLDKLIFFVWWGLLQASAVRRFVGPISSRQVISVRGAAELLRTVNGALADAGFLYGVAQITRGSIAAVVAAAGIPVVCHFAVLLAQATIALPMLDGGPGANGDVVIAVGIGWGIVVAVALAVRLGLRERLMASSIGPWLRNVELRALGPFLVWFALLAGFDVLIQGLASRAFGVAIDWWALVARIPILYFFISLPSFGNFGTREIAWAASFSAFGTREELVAYAFATNTIFLLLHAAIGVAFLPRAVSLLGDLRAAQRAGQRVPRPLLHDASDP